MMRKLLVYLSIVVISACAEDREFEIPEPNCLAPESANATFEEVKSMFQGETMLISEENVIAGYVVSSDKAGNFFGSLHLQDHPASPTSGFRLELDLRDAHLFYPMGSLILIQLKGMYLGASRGSYELGGAFPAFGNLSVGRLPASAIKSHLFLGCAAQAFPEPLLVRVRELKDSLLNTLVRIDDLEFLTSENNQAYAIPEEETIQTLRDCEGEELIMVNSGYSDFRDSNVPSGRGSITGILTKEGNKYALIIRDTTDVDFTRRECSDVVDPVADGQILISEIADPDNNNQARFVELYNAGDSDVPLLGWHLQRYTNANTEVGASQDLSAALIKSKGTMVIAADSLVFRDTFGFLPELQGVGNGPADSNGDDTIVLLDPHGEVRDIFGKIGEDGSGTAHEFEDGRAVRKEGVVWPNTDFTPSEWLIYNDSGMDGTIQMPQIAPDDFSPGQHPD